MYLNRIASYWDTRAEGYSLTIQEQLAGSECDLFRALLRRHAPAGHRLSCLDVGCGPGFFSILLAQDGHKVTAVDYSEGMLEQARKNFGELGVCVTAQRGDAQSLPFPDGAFDYIVSRNLVWNLEHPERAYREWLRLLKPGGRLFVADGNHYLYYYDAEYRAARGSDADRPHPGTHGVDPAPINEIARDLPLSHQRRPEWDTRTLLELGAESLQLQVLRRTAYQDTEEKSGSVVAEFAICAEKPGSRFEFNREQQKIDDDWTDDSNHYSRIIHDELESFRAKAWTKKILTHAPQKPVLDILDAGCGPAFFSVLMAKAGHRVTGVDGSVGMLHFAVKNAAEYGVSPLFLRADCHQLPFADGSFDLVVSRNVTHTLRNHGQAYSEWFRVLRPGGKLLIFDANWHLMQTDRELRRAFAAREEACIRQYGSNFSGGKREVENWAVVEPHRLGTCIRPEWDIPVLQRAGFTDLLCEKDITDGLWDEKEKLLYGLTPMFMIAASKR
ncbi:MAG: methyltransferase domain-containing protein [Intestinimonas sp.]|nr:methyltransferase domain-containing protein [Intestinimonas sp.]